MVSGKSRPLLPGTYDEDDFDLEAYRHSAHERARAAWEKRAVQRKLGVYKFFIMLAALAVTIALYSLINKLVVHIDAIRYSGAGSQVSIQL